MRPRDRWGRSHRGRELVRVIANRRPAKQEGQDGDLLHQERRKKGGFQPKYGCDQEKSFDDV